uniref:Isocitrate dehydrogenase (IDH1, IDH2, icd) n=1 Tax=uncultured marine thaumarchaeote AD1000_54_E04 TaxID=1455924 RepID=A0A075FU53_9ARCH|nr:isocitrate dehydrogenase (IDH1, IDH2, icd) [uncultured marine thaumarchaeote AD1000_54_E04]
MIIKGDGIGPEVVDLMLNVLKECNMQAEIINCEAGSEQWEKMVLKTSHIFLM